MCPAVVVSDAACNRQRTWLDFQITSHIPFSISIAYSVYMRFYELALLTTLVVACSVQYHRNRERVCVAAYMDNVTASLLTLYGVCQLIASPNTTILLMNMLLALVTVCTYVLSFIDRYRHLYPVVHPIGMHVVPALWCINVAAFQHPFFTLRS